jgi:peptidoglycan/LPS O-acetylase OafA/YrhL
MTGPPPVRIRERPGYLPSLDGWRAIAILGVIAVHDPTIVLRGHSLRWLQDYGGNGVNLFFAISGVLICSRILEEESLTGRFHLKLFYIRRIFRIQPAALVYLAVIGLLTLCGILHEHAKYWFGALLLYQNFLFHPDRATEIQGFFTGHFWTLAVEEHFYLLISLALFIIKKHRLAIFTAAFLLVKIGHKIGIYYAPDALIRRTYWQIQLLLLPSLAALLLREPQVRTAVVRWMKPGWVLLLTGSACVLAGLRSAALVESILLYAFTFWVVSTMLHPLSWTTRALEWRPLRFIGRISYSIYLWHVLFFSTKIGPPVSSHLLLMLSERPWKYVCAFAVATASYYLIEKPFVRMGHRLAPPATAGHKDLTDLPVLINAKLALAEKERV